MMIVVPALVLPRDDELEILGRTVEQTLGRSVESIDVIGRGRPVSSPPNVPLTTNEYFSFISFVDPLSRASLTAWLCLEICLLTVLLDILCGHEGWQSYHRPRRRLTYAYEHHGIRGPSLSSFSDFGRTLCLVV